MIEQGWRVAVSTTLERLGDALSGRYRLERELGRGGAAIVYLAQDMALRRAVALKVLRPEIAETLGTDRFLREIAMVARLSHPRILPLYDKGEAAGLPYYVMPYVEGESLEVRLEREQRLDVAEALRITQDVAEALDFAHAHGIVHRDIKPGNILFSAGLAVVTDFGVARAIGAATDSATPTGIAIGTPEYMSPEQAIASRQVDGRSDIYSLGCVLYEMLAGSPPFVARTAQAVIARHTRESPPSLRVVRPEVPDWVERAVFLALAKPPGARPQTGRDLACLLAAP